MIINMAKVSWWERLVDRYREWRIAPYGRCSKHGCPVLVRSHSLGGYDSMEIEFCPTCEQEEYQEKRAKWMPIKSRKPSDDSPLTPSRVTV